MRNFVLLIAYTLVFYNICAFAIRNNYATCSGGKSCHACKNCKYCKHCAKDGGTCSVCK